MAQENKMAFDYCSAYEAHKGITGSVNVGYGTLKEDFPEPAVTYDNSEHMPIAKKIGRPLTNYIIGKLSSETITKLPKNNFRQYNCRKVRFF